MNWWERPHCVGDVNCTPLKSVVELFFPFFVSKDMIFVAVGMDGYKVLKKSSDGIFSKRNKISER